MLRNIETENTEKYRYERKFFISKLTKYEVESLIKLHPAMFSEIYFPRFVNNLYFDSFNMKSYFDSVDGSPNRRKIRIRWYGDLFGDIEKPVPNNKPGTTQHSHQIINPNIPHPIGRKAPCKIRSHLDIVAQIAAV